MKPPVPQVGARAEQARTFSAADVRAYRDLCGDAGLGFAPAATSVRTETVQAESVQAETVPGPLLGGMISQLLGTELPGHGTIWLEQTLRFPAAAAVGVPLTAAVEVIEGTQRNPHSPVRLRLRTTVSGPGGVVVAEGEARVLLPVAR